MKRFLYLLLLLLPLSIHAQEDGKYIDFSKYCGTWKYENADTTFIISFKKSTVQYKDILWGDYLVGGYRLTVKDKFDDNYLTKFDEIPDKIYLKEGQRLDTNCNIYIQGSSRGSDKDYGLNLFLFDQRTKSKETGMFGLRIMILPDGTMKWWLDNSVTINFEDFVIDYNLSVPKYAILKKVE